MDTDVIIEEHIDIPILRHATYLLCFYEFRSCQLHSYFVFKELHE